MGYLNNTDMPMISSCIQKEEEKSEIVANKYPPSNC